MCLWGIVACLRLCWNMWYLFLLCCGGCCGFVFEVFAHEFQVLEVVLVRVGWLWVYVVCGVD